MEREYSSVQMVSHATLHSGTWERDMARYSVCVCMCLCVHVCVHTCGLSLVWCTVILNPCLDYILVCLPLHGVSINYISF